MSYNRDYNRKYQAEWRKKNRERVRLYKRNWRRKNPLRVRLHEQKTRTKPEVRKRRNAMNVASRKRRELANPLLREQRLNRARERYRKLSPETRLRYDLVRKYRRSGISLEEARLAAGSIPRNTSYRIHRMETGE